MVADGWFIVMWEEEFEGAVFVSEFIGWIRRYVLEGLRLKMNLSMR